MILGINYATPDFYCSQKFNAKTALKNGVDKVKSYTPEDIPEDFKQKNDKIWNSKRGAGYWIWKPYIIMDALQSLSEGDYVIYADSGSAYINNVHYLIDAMNKAGEDIMAFSLTHLERTYTKRDAFVLMDADTDEIANSPQICATYIIVRKASRSLDFINQYLLYAQDPRIISDSPNELGKENYEGFIAHRHDQSIFSLLCKKNGIKPFRDPSQYGNNKNDFLQEINARSDYPQIFDSHRKKDIRFAMQLESNRFYPVWKIVSGVKRRLKAVIYE